MNSTETITIILAVLISFAISAGICPVLIPFLHKLKFGQEVRDDGPQSHIKKQGTPTMGGIAFIIAIVITSLIFGFSHPMIWPVLIMTVGFGIIGFIDDFLKVVKHNTKGLLPWQKLLLQFILMAGFCFYMMQFNELGTTIVIPFVKTVVDLKWFYPIFMFIVILGTDNGVNFTDGVDGLCASVTSVVATFLTVAALIMGRSELTPITAAVLGSLLGYLLFNVHPAKVFMGDTGSLALGGFVASAFIMLGQPLLIIIVGFVYLAEVISAVMQVGYFKITKKKYGEGRRIFRMAPIHHHFELGGWSETRVVAVFTIVTVLLCAVALLGI